MSQNISGFVIDNDGNSIEYVNIGITDKNIGTVSNKQGYFNLSINSEFYNDTLLFSCIGYNSYTVKISDLSKNENTLTSKKYVLDEVRVPPSLHTQKSLGIKTRSKSINAGFENNLPGYECGIIIHQKKKAFIKKVNLNISTCSYDTIFYRVNIYKVSGDMNFTNILKNPIYINLPKELINDEIQIDLQNQNIIVEGDFLITLEHIKYLGQGKLNFCSSLFNKTYIRKTSQGKWITAPIGISINVIADIYNN